MRHMMFSVAMLAGILATSLALTPAPRVAAQGRRVGVYTYHYDTKRTGWNASETQLTQASVAGGRFGKLWSRPVDGQVYAQPLYVPDLNMGALGTHSVVFVATQHNSVYAFDADTGGDTPLWKVSLGPSVPSPSVMPCRDIEGPEYGITSTPVIDPAARTIYVVAKSLESGRQIYRLHALDITTGQSQPGWPVEMRGSVTGNSGGSAGGRIAFNPAATHLRWVPRLQRPGLLLLNGRVVIGVGSTCDIDIIRYHGWVFSCSASDPRQAPLVWCTTPEFSQGPFPESAAGIWQAGFGLATDDAGNIYFESGRSAPAATGSSTRTWAGATGGGPSARQQLRAPLHRRRQPHLHPQRRQLLHAEQRAGARRGRRGPRLRRLHGDPGPAAGHHAAPPRRLRQGWCRPAAQPSLGGHTGRIDASTPDNAIQNWPGLGGTWSGPAYWEGPDGNYIFYTGMGNPLRRFRIGLRPDGSSRAYLILSRQSTDRFTTFPNPTPVVSSDGKKPGTGVVWLLSRTGGTLRAYSADDPTNALWHSRQVAEDSLGASVVKFSVPIVANGRVYAGTRTGLVCYGLRG